MTVTPPPQPEQLPTTKLLIYAFVEVMLVPLAVVKLKPLINSLVDDTLPNIPFVILACKIVELVKVDVAKVEVPVTMSKFEKVVLVVKTIAPPLNATSGVPVTAVVPE